MAGCDRSSWAPSRHIIAFGGRDSDAPPGRNHEGGAAGAAVSRGGFEPRAGTAGAYRGATAGRAPSLLASARAAGALDRRAVTRRRSDEQALRMAVASS